ncbi:MAG: hypothetical protein RLZZ596_445 [Pseudomonadota bacterium]
MRFLFLSLRGLWLLSWLCLGAMVSRAEDIDLYSGTSSNAGKPNVLFVLDNAANFDSAADNCTYSDGSSPSLNGKAGGIEQCALYNVVNSLSVNSDNTGVVNIGLMAYNATNIRDINNANCGGSVGGCLMVPLMEMTSANKSKFLTWVKSWKLTGGAGDGYIKANGEATAAAMQEAWAYYYGATGLSGRSYSGVQPPAGCQKNFVIFIGNAFTTAGTPGDGGSASPANALAAAPGITSALLSPITIPPGSYGTSTFSCGNYSMPNHTNPSGLYADEWARYMYQTDLYSNYIDNQGITTYTIGLLGTSCKPDYPALLNSMANVGGGKYYATSSYSEISTAIAKILNEVQATNSVFTSASLPVSVNAQGTYLNQIFLGMFRPDASASPRWLGNLKQYQFIMDSAGNLQLGDSTGSPALSSAGTGFISTGAVSFWTNKNTASAPDSTGGFFVNKPSGDGGAFDSPDGELVEKGGTAQQLRKELLSVNYTSSPATPRRLYTYCPSGSSCNSDLTASANLFATTNSAITKELLGKGSDEERNLLINWVRGHDNFGDEASPGSGYTVRPSIHGDVLHSRPVVVNYGDGRGLVVFYGANDGVFRAVNGSQTAAIGSVSAGGELWGLVLPEHFQKLNRQRINSPELKLPSTLSNAGAQPKDYFVDGSPSAYQLLKADGTIDKAYLYLTMRRGGRFIYALDVSEPTAPTVLWKISNATPGFAELGQTWSRPRVTLLKGYVDTSTPPKSKPVLIFAAGYDPAEDSEPPTANTMGRGIFIVDAITGALIWRATSSADTSSCPTGATCVTSSAMSWSFPSDISFVDRDSDGYTDRLYAADVGGNVWRVDLEPAGNTPDKWQISQFAALGCSAGACASGTTPRKFFYPPSVLMVGVAGNTGSYDAVLIGSGDREHPLISTASGSAYQVTNRFYMLKDVNTSKVAPPSGTPVITETASSPLGLFNATDNSYDGTRKGYFVTLANTGEKSVNAATTVQGITYFGTNQPEAPSGNSCSANLGVARGYALSPFAGTRSVSNFDGGGLPPSPVAGIVNIQVGDKTVQQQFCIGCGGSSGAIGGDAKSGFGISNPNKTVPMSPRRTYWYKR